MDILRFTFSADKAQKNPNFYSLNVHVFSAPGLYVPTHLVVSDPSVTKILDAVQRYTAPECSILDNAGPLGHEILHQFPGSRGITIKFRHHISKFLWNGGLISADCSRVINKGKIHLGSPQDYFIIRTSWTFADSTNPQGRGIELNFKTKEHASSLVHNSEHEARHERQESSLAFVHPTYLTHQSIASLAKGMIDRRSESTLSDLAWLAYELTDEQSSCKRLREVSLQFKAFEPQAESRRGKSPQMQFALKLSREQYEQSRKSLMDYTSQKGRNRAYVALGSNLGNRIGMIELACQEMSKRDIQVTRTSALYETNPMYLEDQNRFINGTCEVSGTLRIMALAC